MPPLNNGSLGPKVPDMESVKSSTIFDPFDDTVKDGEIMSHPGTPRNHIDEGAEDNRARNGAIAGEALPKISETPTNLSNISDIPKAENVFEPNNIEAPDTLDSLLSFLKTHGDSPVSGLLDLRGLLLEQKEEKVMLRTLVDEMRVDIASLRYALYHRNVLQFNHLHINHSCVRG